MKVIKLKNKIIIEGLEDFNLTHCECGQAFRFFLQDNFTRVLSAGKMADVFEFENKAEIVTQDVDYFYNYFDLATDYSQIKTKLKVNPLMTKAVEKGYGIRILKQDTFEVIITFIISQNNNIKRIKGIIDRICKTYGVDMGGYFTFPTLHQLQKADEKFFKSIGAGYRSIYLEKAIKQLAGECSYLLQGDCRAITRNDLLKLMGVGPKVADCILLFGYGRHTSFPVDTWIAKVYEDDFKGKLTDRIKIAEFFTDTFKDLSGYAQQYLFYYKREL